MSNLLEKASILTTATAYDDGKILSVKPAKPYSDEITVNGNFATDSDWTKDAGWTISNGEAIHTGSGSYISQTGTTIGKNYKVVIEVTQASGSGFPQIYMGGLTTAMTSAGTYTFDITATSTLIRLRGVNDCKLTSISVKEVLHADFDFTRNSSATRVNSQGLVEDVQILSSNLVQNGDFSQEGAEQITNGGFDTDLSGWTYSSGVTWNNGKAEVDALDGSFKYIEQIITSSGTKTYKISFEISNIQGSVQLTEGTSLVTEKSTNGTFEVYYETTTTNPAIQFKRKFGTNTFFELDNVSVKEVGQDWTLDSSCTIELGKANFLSSTSISPLYQSSPYFIIGKTYKITYTVSNYSAGRINWNDFGAGAGNGVNRTANGTYTDYYVKVGTSTNFGFQTTFGFTGSISNISVIEITDDTNLPRIDYTDGVGSWLFEPQSTNLVTYSEDFSQSYWRKDKITVTDNSIISPSGQLDASLIQETVYTSGIPSLDLLSSITLSAGTYTYTFYVKNNNGRYLGINFGSNAERIRTNFDFNTNTFKTLIFNGTTTGSASFTALGDYYRISITATFPSSTAADIVLMPLATDTYPFYVFQNSDNRSFYLWGAQVEAQSFATSYIPTSGSTVTRLQDTAFGAGSSDLINSTEGVLYAEIAALSDDLTNKQISLNNGTTDDRIQLYYSSSSNQISVFYKSQSGATAFILNHTLSDITQFNKVAFKWKQNDFALWSNGVEVATQTSGVTSIANTLTKLDFTQFNGSADFFGKTKCLAVFKEALTDEELTCLTTI